MERYNLWFFLKRAEDLPGQWVAHCLDLDVVTQGDGASHAIQMLAEAVAMTIEHARAAGRDPFTGRRAPQESWDELYDLLEHGERVDAHEMLDRPDPAMVALAGGFTLLLEPKSNVKPKQTVRAAVRSRVAGHAALSG